MYISTALLQLLAEIRRKWGQGIKGKSVRKLMSKFMQEMTVVRPRYSKGSGKKWSASAYVLKKDPIGFAYGSGE